MKNNEKTMEKRVYITSKVHRILRDLGIYVLPMVDNSNILLDVVIVEGKKSLGTVKYPIELQGAKLTTRGMTIKIGKLLSNITNLTPLEIEEATTKFKRLFVDTSKVQISEDIGGIYDISSVGGSCMSLKGHFMDIYEDLGCKIAYILDDENNRLLARCILWEELLMTSIDEEGFEEERIIKGYDRIFFNNEVNKIVLSKYLENKGYLNIRESTNTFETLTALNPDVIPYQNGVPYIDTLYKLTSDYRLCNTEDDDVVDYLQQTTGCSSAGIASAMDTVYCVDMDDYYPTEDCFYVEDDDEWYYYDDNLVYVEGEYYRQDSSSIAYVEDENEYVLADNAVYIPELGCNYTENNEDLVFAEDIEEMSLINLCIYYEGYYYRNIDDFVFIDGDYYRIDDDKIVWAMDIKEWILKEESFYTEDTQKYFYDDSNLTQIDGYYYEEEQENGN